MPEGEPTAKPSKVVTEEDLLATTQDAIRKAVDAEKQKEPQAKTDNMLEKILKPSVDPKQTLRDLLSKKIK